MNRYCVEYSQQHKFGDCKHKRKLPFDFYLPELNTCIEYNGKQHYEPIDFFGGDCGFKEQQIRDMVKNKYCYENNIKLLTIKYDENIKSKLLSLIDGIKPITKPF